MVDSNTETLLMIYKNENPHRYAGAKMTPMKKISSESFFSLRYAADEKIFFFEMSAAFEFCVSSSNFGFIG